MKFTAYVYTRNISHMLNAILHTSPACCTVRAWTGSSSVIYGHEKARRSSFTRKYMVRRRIAGRSLGKAGQQEEEEEEEASRSDKDRIVIHTRKGEKSYGSGTAVISPKRHCFPDKNPSLTLYLSLRIADHSLAAISTYFYLTLYMECGLLACAAVLLNPPDIMLQKINLPQSQHL